MAAFEASYADALRRHREAHREQAVPMVVPTSTVLPLDALIFSTRRLMQITDGVEAAVRVALHADGAELVQAAPARRSSLSIDLHGSAVDGQCACGAPL